MKTHISLRALALLLSAAALAGCESQVDDGGGAGGGGGGEPSQPREVVLTSAVGELAGVGIAVGGDVNGDGRVDLLIGAPGNGEGPAGRVHVITGPIADPELPLDEAPGFVIVGERDGDHVGAHLAGVGDVNGDGLDDVLITAEEPPIPFDGCYHDCPPRPPFEGSLRSYVVFGREDGADVSLADVAAGRGGFALDAADPQDLRYQDVAPLGDLDGDGLADFAIAAPVPAAGNGRLYVVFGRRETAPVALDAIGTTEAGFVVEGDTLTYFGSLAAAGDVNGDGLGDLVIGDTASGEGGRAWVVLGKASRETVTTADLEQGRFGFVIEAEPNVSDPPCCTSFGVEVAGGGDVDGDGLDDVVVGAPGFGAGSFPGGRVYVVSGRTETSPVLAADVAAGRGGFAIDGEDGLGLSLAAGLVDLDGDDRADLLTAGKLGDPELRTAAAPGEAAPIVPATEGPWYLDRGSSVGDLDGDGVADLVLVNVDSLGERPGSVLIVLRGEE